MKTLIACLVALLVASISTSAHAEPSPTELSLNTTVLVLEGVSLKDGAGLPFGGLLEFDITLRGPFGPCGLTLGFGAQSDFSAFEPNPQVRTGVGCLALPPGENHVGIAIGASGIYRARPGYGARDLAHQILGVAGVALILEKGGSALLFTTGPAHIVGNRQSTIWSFAIGWGHPLAMWEW